MFNFFFSVQLNYILFVDFSGLIILVLTKLIDFLTLRSQWAWELKAGFTNYKHLIWYIVSLSSTLRILNPSKRDLSSPFVYFSINFYPSAISICLSLSGFPYLKRDPPILDLNLQILDFELWQVCGISRLVWHYVFGFISYSLDLVCFHV